MSILPSRLNRDQLPNSHFVKVQKLMIAIFFLFFMNNSLIILIFTHYLKLNSPA